MTEYWIVDPVGTPFMCYLYILIGILCIACNLLNLSVLLSSKDLRRKYLFFIVLDAGELVNAVAYLLTGIGRYWEFSQGVLSSEVTVYECFYKRLWPFLLIIGMQLPALTIVVISGERICAVSQPFLFKRIFEGATKWMFVIIIPTLAVISLFIAALSAINNGDERAMTQHCGIINSTAKWYSTFHFSFIAAAYICSLISLFVVWRVFNINKTNRIGPSPRFRTTILLVTLTTVLVAVPSVVQICIRWQFMAFQDMFIGATYALPGLISLATTAVNFICREDFRHQLLHYLGIKKEVIKYNRGSQHQNSIQLERRKSTT